MSDLVFFWNFFQTGIKFYWFLREFWTKGVCKFDPISQHWNINFFHSSPQNTQCEIFHAFLKMTIRNTVNLRNSVTTLLRRNNETSTTETSSWQWVGPNKVGVRAGLVPHLNTIVREEMVNTTRSHVHTLHMQSLTTAHQGLYRCNGKTVQLRVEGRNHKLDLI